MTARNPKQEGTILFDCIPQSGRCQLNCNQCFFNRPGAFYTDTPSVPTPEEVGSGIVRMNCGHDSNIEKQLVVDTAKKYKHAFFNTSIPDLDFPGPVVFTANRDEESYTTAPPDNVPTNLMFVRLRVSGTNGNLVHQGVRAWTLAHVPVVLTFMAYYDFKPSVDPCLDLTVDECYEWKVRHINPYYCPTPLFIQKIRDRYRNNRLVSMCGGIYSNMCRDCRNCETYFIQTSKRMRNE